LEQSHLGKFAIIHEKPAGFLGKSQTLTYEAYEFSNGKVTWMDEDGEVFVGKSHKKALKNLNKQGQASIRGKNT